MYNLLELLNLAYGKKIGQTGFFNLGYVTSLEEKSWNQNSFILLENRTFSHIISMGEGLGK